MVVTRIQTLPHLWWPQPPPLWCVPLCWFLALLPAAVYTGITAPPPPAALLGDL